MIGVSEPLKHHDRERYPRQRRHRTQEFEYREDVLLEAHRPSQKEAERNAYSGREKEGDRDAARAHPDVHVIFGSEDRQSVGRISAKPLAHDLRRTRHLGEAGQFPDLDRQVPETDKERKADQHQVRARAFQPQQETMNRERKRTDIADPIVRQCQWYILVQNTNLAYLGHGEIRLMRPRQTGVLY